MPAEIRRVGRKGGPDRSRRAGVAPRAWEQPFYLKFLWIATQIVQRVFVGMQPCRSLLEHGDLALIVGGAAAGAAGGADYG